MNLFLEIYVIVSVETITLIDHYITYMYNGTSVVTWSTVIYLSGKPEALLPD